MSEFKKRRTQYLVDKRTQGALVLRTVLYWGFCLLSVTLMLFCWRIISEPPQPFRSHFMEMWHQFGPALIASLVLLPLIMVDALRLSNRFVGPMYRLKRSMEALSRGETVRPIKFRDADFWHECAAVFNALLKRVSEAERNPEVTEVERGHHELLATATEVEDV